MSSNLTLIGMPGSGKSTVGKRVADLVGWDFLDLDARIEAEQGKKLSQINAEGGHAKLQLLEDAAARSITCSRTVIGPGGSIVYLDDAMRHLQSLGPIVFLDVPIDVLIPRCGDMQARGVVVREGDTLADLLGERLPKLLRWADVRIFCGHRTADDVAHQIAGTLQLQR
ncbi:MAG: shikimate kinase [Planctomycetota bacterium]